MNVVTIRGKDWRVLSVADGQAQLQVRAALLTAAQSLWYILLQL